MAKDLVVVRADLYRSPWVIGVAKYLLFSDDSLFEYSFDSFDRPPDILSISSLVRNAVCGSILTVAAYFEEHGTRIENRLFIDGLSVVDIDDIVGIVDIGMALKKAGWLVDSQNGLWIPYEERS
jgi:hypothetical protein